MRVFLQTKDGNDIELDMNEFFRKTKTFVFGEISKEQAIHLLDKSVQEIYKAVEKFPPDELSQIYAYAVEKKLSYELLIFEQFVNYYSEKLNEVLCNKSINPKYIKGYGNPSVANLSMFNILRGPVKDSIIIKGFLYGTNPVDNELYVSTTCGTGGTSLLFETLKRKIKEGSGEWDKITYIKLDSVENPNTIKFYGKLGFYKSNKESASILRDMIKHIYGKRKYDFNKYVNKTTKIVGGTMYWFKSDSIRKNFSVKCSYEYHPELWYINLEGIKDNGVSKRDAYKYFVDFYKKEALTGAGLTDWFKRGLKKIVEAKEKVFDVLGYIHDYTNRSKQSIIDFGNDQITKLEIVRTPIFIGWDVALDYMSNNRWFELKKKYGFDKLFHLSLIATVLHNNSPTQVIIEKNERINISPDFKLSEATEKLDVPVVGKNVTILTMLSNARNAIGDKDFFDYDAFKNNCQYFIRNLLQYSGLLNKENEAFLFQDIENIVKELPPDLPVKIKGVTWLGALLSKLTGRGSPTNQELYDKVKKEVYAKNPKHSLFRSAQIVKEYKRRGGEYTDVKPASSMDIKKWFKQEWITLNDYYHNNEIVPCGSSNTKEKFGEYPLCRPLKLAKKLGKEKIGEMLKEKKGPKQLKTREVLGTKRYNIKPTLTGTGPTVEELKAQYPKLSSETDEKYNDRIDRLMDRAKIYEVEGIKPVEETFKDPAETLPKREYESEADYQKRLQKVRLQYERFKKAGITPAMRQQAFMINAIKRLEDEIKSFDSMVKVQQVWETDPDTIEKKKKIESKQQFNNFMEKLGEEGSKVFEWAKQQVKDDPKVHPAGKAAVGVVESILSIAGLSPEQMASDKAYREELKRRKAEWEQRMHEYQSAMGSAIQTKKIQLEELKRNYQVFLQNNPSLKGSGKKLEEFQTGLREPGKESGYELHAVVFKKPFDLQQAKIKAQDFIRDKKKHFYRETSTSYRFRNIPKTKFEKGTFRSKKVDPNITIIVGKVKNQK